MSIRLRWVGESDLDRVAETRARCYATAEKEVAQYRERIHKDGRVQTADLLLAERDGEAVGTTTSLPMTMWVRGAALSCQGVAWVGTIRTARRGGAVSDASSAGGGIASQLMREALRKARERAYVVSALMPFRASFYEHFGYGVVERRARWSVPMAALPSGNCEGLRFADPQRDAEAIAQCVQYQTERGQCDIETTPAAWAFRQQFEEGFSIVDRPDRDGPARGWAFIADTKVRDRRYVDVDDLAWRTPADFRRLLHFVASLKDQYGGAVLTLPTDLPLNQMLRESQVPHRPVDHPTAECATYTRMQVRVLDHVRFFERLRLPDAAKAVRGAAVLAIRETEGTVSKIRLEVTDGRTRARPTDASADVECSDVTWATIACGTTPATIASRWGLMDVTRDDALPVLDALAVGPVPYCNEYF